MKSFPIKSFIKGSLLIFFSASQAYGSLSALEKIYKSFGGQMNASAPGGFQDQAAGYYTGGGLYMRNRNTTAQPISVSPPHMASGCNGLDMYMGAFSFMKGEQLVQLIRGIGTSVPTYALQLALKTMSPQIENLLSQLRKVVLDLNGMMLDSCQAAQQLVGGLWPKGTAASEHICQDVSRSGGEDWFGARKHCTKPEQIQANVEKAKEKNKDLLQGEYNLTWRIVRGKLKYDEELASFMMTLLGTVISRKEAAGYRVIFVEGLADDHHFIEAYLKGGVAKRRICQDTEKCLDTHLGDLAVPLEKSLTHKLLERTGRLRTSYIEMKPLLDEDKAFLNDAATLPLYRYIEVSVAARSEFLMLDACEHMALTLLLIQFEKVAREILDALDQLSGVQIDDSALKKFQKQIQATRHRLLILQSVSKPQAVQYFNTMIQGHEKIITAKGVA